MAGQPYRSDARAPFRHHRASDYYHLLGYEFLCSEVYLQPSVYLGQAAAPAASLVFHSFDLFCEARRRERSIRRLVFKRLHICARDCDDDA